jgi:hypothetical protein
MMMFYGWSAAWFQVHHQASVSRITNRGKTGVLGLGIIASARYAKLRRRPRPLHRAGEQPRKLTADLARARRCGETPGSKISTSSGVATRQPLRYP